MVTSNGDSRYSWIVETFLHFFRWTVPTTLGISVPLVVPTWPATFSGHPGHKRLGILCTTYFMQMDIPTTYMPGDTGLTYLCSTCVWWEGWGQEGIWPLRIRSFYRVFTKWRQIVLSWHGKLFRIPFQVTASQDIVTISNNFVPRIASPTVAQCRCFSS